MLRLLPRKDVRPPRSGELNPHVRLVPDIEMRIGERTALNRLCDISDWRLGRFLEILAELKEVPFVHRKAWEYGTCNRWGFQVRSKPFPDSRLGLFWAERLPESTSAGHSHFLGRMRERFGACLKS